jgi:hypothetical protein
MTPRPKNEIGCQCHSDQVAYAGGSRPRAAWPGHGVLRWDQVCTRGSCGSNNLVHDLDLLQASIKIRSSFPMPRLDSAYSTEIDSLTTPHQDEAERSTRAIASWRGARRVFAFFFFFFSLPSYSSLIPPGVSLAGLPATTNA